MVTDSCGWQYCKLTCYCICRPWYVVDVMEHELIIIIIIITGTIHTHLKVLAFHFILMNTQHAFPLYFS
jgi:hypothetical protein